MPVIFQRNAAIFLDPNPKSVLYDVNRKYLSRIEQYRLAIAWILAYEDIASHAGALRR